MASSTLETIITKVRRLTRSPSTNQLSDDVIKFYVNTFIAWDFPEHLRLKGLRTTLTWYTQANIDTYTTNTTVTTDPLYNFKNKYISVHEPIYIAGYRVFYTQSREQLFNIYPFITYIQQIGLGDAIGTTTFSGTITQHPILKNNVVITSIDTTGASISLVDYPDTNNTGSFGPIGQPPTVFPSVFGGINYINGQFIANFDPSVFTNPPDDGQKVNAQTVPYQPARPVAVCFYQDTFTLRPVPDQAYAVNMEVYVQPTELIDSSDTPDYSEFWQYIAYGAAKKIFEDRSDIESVKQIMPEFLKQEELINRRTIVQQTNERSATIYTEQAGLNTGMLGWPGWWVNG